MWTDGRADSTKLIVAFRNFVKAPPPPKKTHVEEIRWFPAPNITLVMKQNILDTEKHSAVSSIP